MCAMGIWANQHGVNLHFADLGKPMQKAYSESINGKFRDECLDLHRLACLVDATKKEDRGLAGRVQQDTAA